MGARKGSGDGRAVGRARWLAVAISVAIRPQLWSVAVVQVFRLARRGWWRRPPFLPLPDPEYLRFRLETAYGGDPPDRDGVETGDVLTYLRWCRRFPG